jgi:thiol:disulfide interchange protein DsbD
VNKKTSLQDAAVEARLKQDNVLTLIGDYTKKDPVIRAELEKFGRAGVPLNLVYPKDASKPPMILPEFLTPSIVLDSLDAAVNQTAQ